MITTKSGLSIRIRKETPDDYAKVHELVDRAFSTTHLGDDDTAEYHAKVRKKDTFVPDLSFVAELADGSIVGQVTLFHTDIITETGRIKQLVLSPISVLPEYFGKGIAREMIGFALSKARGMGYVAVFLQGNPRFYEKFGFEPSYKYDIYHEKDEDRNAEYCMVNVLVPGGLDGITGQTYYQ